MDEPFIGVGKKIPRFVCSFSFVLFMVRLWFCLCDVNDRQMVLTRRALGTSTWNCQKKKKRFLGMWTHRCYIKSVVFEILKLLWASFSAVYNNRFVVSLFSCSVHLVKKLFCFFFFRFLFFISDFLVPFVSMSLQCYNTENNVGFSPSNALHSLCKNLSTEVFDLGNGFVQGGAY